jgi:RNA polymerase-binding transcription factor DksA
MIANALAGVTVTQRIHFAEMLRRTREECFLTLAATNAVLARREQRRPSPRPDTVVGADVDALLREESGRLVAIAEAQRLIRDVPEMFGVCEECGRQIELDRLDVAPWTTRCAEHSGEAHFPVC